MKLLLTFLIAATTSVCFAQDKQVDTVNFCGFKYRVPAMCKTRSQYQVVCESFFMQWIYMNDDQLKKMPLQFMAQLSRQLDDFYPEMITPFLMDKEVRGYKVTFETDNGTRYQVIAYGVINRQPVLVQLVLEKEPKTNEDIPSFARQILKLTK